MTTTWTVCWRYRGEQRETTVEAPAGEEPRAVADLALARHYGHGHRLHQGQSDWETGRLVGQLARPAQGGGTDLLGRVTITDVSDR